jgi:hypothetical protein
VWAGAKDVAKGGEQLQENGLGLGLGVGGQGAHGFSGEAIERVLVEYGLAGVLGRGRRLLVERGGQGRDWGRSRVRVRRTGCVPRREICLGKQVFSLLF